MRFKTILALPLVCAVLLSCSDSVTGPGDGGPLTVVYSTKRGSAILYTLRADSVLATPRKVYDDVLLATPPARGTVAWLVEASATESQVFVGSTDGAGPVEVTASSDPNRAVSLPVVSPDGNKVAWTTADNRLYIVGTDGSNLAGLAQVAYYGTIPVFSPDGRRLAFYSNQGGLCVVNTDGTGFRVVADNADEDPVSPLGVSWTPSGDRLVYIGSLPNGNRDLFTVRPDSTDRQNLTNDGAFETSPKFSPDGSRIVFVRAGAGLVVMNADGSGSSLVTNAGSGVDAFPEWSPDGTRLLFVSRATTATDIGFLKILDIASKSVTLVTADVFHGFWSR